MSGSSPLFALPPELRNHIYDILKAEQTDYKTIRITSGSIVLHPLTRTCQQIRKESSPVLQPDNLDDTIWIVVQVFDFKLDALNRILLSLPIPEHRIVMLHTTMMLTAPGAECMVQLHRWLTARRTEALHPLARPRFAFDSLNRFYSAQIDWTTHSLATANSIVNTLTGLKLGNVTKGLDASGIHSAVATTVKRRQNELMGVTPGRSMLGVMSRPRKGVKMSLEVEDGGAKNHLKNAGRIG